MSDHINYVDLNNERRYFEDSAGRSGVAPVEATAIASKAYAVGDYFWYSNILYKVTTAIASGGSIVPGTNVTQVTLSDEVNQLNRQLSDLGNVTAFKAAILQLAQKVAYIDEHGQDYYDDLHDAFYPPVSLASISAVFTQGQTVVYNTDSLDVLKPMLVVTATYSDSTTQTVTGYTLSGTLTEGTSTITVSYGGKTDTFSVTVTHQAGTYSVTNTLTNCTNSNGASTVIEGENYSGTITANAGYTMTGATVRVTMDGTDITSTAYRNGTVSIASVSGNIVINVSAVAVTLSSISAVFTQGQTVVYDTDSLDVLKPMLVVTAVYSDGTSGTVSTSDYTLSGTLSAGTSTITVSYGGKTDTFNVTVTHLAGSYSVANSLTNCTNSNGASSVIENESYSGTITANAGYTMTGATVSITMGGTDITSTAYNNGAISIASVTGNVVITASAVQITDNLIATLALGTHEVYPTDNIQSLKKYLTVELHNGGTTTPVSEYTLSGSIDSVGTHVITISYNNYTTTVNVPVVANTTGILYEWDFTDSLTDLRQNQTATLHTGEAWEIPGKSEGTTIPVQDSTGVVLSDAQQLIRLIGNDVETSQFLLDKTIQVDFGSFNAQGSPDSMRVILVAWDKTLDGTLTHELGLHWVKPSSTRPSSARGWCFCSGGINTETGSRSGMREELAPGAQNDISGKTVSLYYDSTGHASLYFNTTLKGTSNNTIINDVCTNVYGLQIGSGGRTQYGGTLYSGRVTGARIYSGNAMQQ